MGTDLQMDGGLESAETPNYLDLFARAKAALESGVDISVPVTDIRRFEGQPRRYFNKDSISRLSASVATGGQMTRGLVREKPGSTPYELVDGERRWLAISEIPDDTRPLYKAILIEADDDVVQFIISSMANFNREGHTTLETMDTIDRMVGFKIPVEQVAALLGISVTWAYQIHNLKKLVPEVLALLDPELPKKLQLPTTAAIHISKMDSRLQLGLATRVLNRDVSLVSLRAEVVRISDNAGTPVRVREVDARKKWESVLKKVEAAMRTLWDVKTHLNDPELAPYIGFRRKEVGRISRQLADAATTIAACEARIAEVPPTT